LSGSRPGRCRVDIGESAPSVSALRQRPGPDAYTAALRPAILPKTAPDIRPVPCQEGGGCQNVKANQISMRQEMVVIGNEWNFGCCAERREFSIVRIFDEGKVVGIDTAGKL
jgi:hypothetical protein